MRLALLEVEDVFIFFQYFGLDAPLGTEKKYLISQMILNKIFLV